MGRLTKPATTKEPDKANHLSRRSKSKLTEAERAKRIREAARKAETSNDPADFERAFAVVSRAPKPKKQKAGKS
jgi:hypothetical protein